MKASDPFKAVIENYLNDRAQRDSAFALNLSKASKNLESCFNYIFAEVKKIGLCAFDNQEIFDMAVKYYTDDSILPSAPIGCKVVVNQPAQADLFTPTQPFPQTTTEKIEVVQTSKPVQKTLTLFDL
jgi:hypothetical protein